MGCAYLFAEAQENSMVGFKEKICGLQRQEGTYI